jgi:hypothetical protein
MNPITVVPNLYSGALALGIVAALAGGSYGLGHLNGVHKAELACANARGDANAKAAKEWEDAVANQVHRDAAARAADRDAAQKAIQDAQAVADRFAAMKVSVVKLNPPGECTLSPEWIRAFQEAR